MKSQRSLSFRILGSLFALPFLASVACGTSEESSAAPAEGVEPTGPRADPAGSQEDEASADARAPSVPKKDASAAETSSPSSPTTPDGSVDPLCSTEVTALGAFGFDEKESAKDVVFHPAMSVSGVMSPGNTSGDPSPRWFTFVVDQPRDVNISFSCPKAYAAFYYEDDTSSSFSVGYPSATKNNVPLQAGRYYVKLAYTFKRYFGDGPFFDLSMSWSTPPAQCLGGG